MMTAGAPTVNARAEEFENQDLIPDELNEIGHVGTGGAVNKAPAYANMPWYANTGNAANTGRGAYNITPNTSATGNHVVYKANATTGQALMPHVHDKTAVGDVRAPYFDETPEKGGKKWIYYNG